jgi:hypothetical protein
MQLITSVLLLAGVASAFGIEGVENCQNKCDKVFDKTQYAISDQPGKSTFENRACVLGCGKCAEDIVANPDTNLCFKFCKTYPYGEKGIRKGVIEPDKACIIGCTIQTCQQICQGGTTDDKITPANQYLWWGQGGNGCALKTETYVQNGQYGNPNAGQGATSAQEKQCCTNAMNLCEYVGDTNSVNYKNVLYVAIKSCKKVGVPNNKNAICAHWTDPLKCGTPGMGP